MIAIALDNIFKVNQRLEVMVEELPGEHFSSRIEDISVNIMTIAMPMRKGHPVHIGRGTRFWGRVFLENGVYEFRSFMLEKRIYPLPVWVISKPTDVRKIQQRAFVRIDAMLPVEFKVINDENQDNQIIRAITKDISGGGLRIVNKHPLKLGNILQMNIDLPEFGPIEVAAETVRVDKPDQDNDIYWIGVKYLNLPESLRSKIIKFVFKKQLEFRQKGL